MDINKQKAFQYLAKERTRANWKPSFLRVLQKTEHATLSGESQFLLLLKNGRNQDTDCVEEFPQPLPPS